MTKLLLSLAVGLAASAQNPEPTPGVERVAGSVDLGYRWIGTVGGDFQTYRSVVNLGEGVKLLGADLRYKHNHQWLDSFVVRGNGWGGEPSSTAFLEATKSQVYRLNFDYRAISYFNFLPSYADPTISQGIFLNQRSFDTRYRVYDLDLDLLPGKTLVPYFGWSRGENGGRGITNFVAEGNEYPVSTGLDYATDDYRGGVRFERRWLQGFLEQGGLRLNERQSLSTADRNTGNRTTPFVDRTLVLDNLLQSYRTDGSSIYTRAALNAAPASWINLNGQFLFSQPHLNTEFTGTENGTFVSTDPFFFFDSRTVAANSNARQPHSSATVGAEVRAFARLRVVNTYFTDRFHNASSLRAVESLLGGTTITDNARLEVNYNHNQTDAFYDAARRLTLRGGYRFVWGDARVRPAVSSGIEGLEAAGQRQHVGLAGLSYRPVEKVSINLDYEGASASKAYFRTSMADFQKGRARVRYTVSPSLSFTGMARVLDNRNPSPDVQWSFQAQDYGISSVWSPAQGKRFSVLADYTFSKIRSDILYLIPLNGRPTLSEYRDLANTATLAADFGLPSWRGQSGRLTAGGSLFVSEGSRSASYYQPMVRLSLPLERRLQLNSEWRWYGFTQPGYSYEGFRNHQLLVSLRFGF